MLEASTEVGQLPTSSACGENRRCEFEDTLSMGNSSFAGVLSRAPLVTNAPNGCIRRSRYSLEKLYPQFTAVEAVIVGHHVQTSNG